MRREAAFSMAIAVGAGAACAGAPRADTPPASMDRAGAAVDAAPTIDAAAANDGGRAEALPASAIDAAARASTGSESKPRVGAVVEGASTAKATPFACTKPGIFLEVDASIQTKCAESGRCKAPVPFRIVNCNSEAVIPRVLAARSEGLSRVLRPKLATIAYELSQTMENTLDGSPNDVRVPIEGAAPIQPKTRSSGMSVALGAGEPWDLEVYVESSQNAGSFTSAKAKTKVVDKTLEAEIAAAQAEHAAEEARCRARGGKLELVGGIMAVERCVIPLPDTGKVCHDRQDCLGECLLTRKIPLDNGMIRLEGKCSRVETVFGCAIRIWNTPNRSGIVRADTKMPSLCVD